MTSKRKTPAIQLDNRRGNFRKLHGGYQVLENLLTGSLYRQLQPHSAPNLVQAGDLLQPLAQSLVDLLALQPHLHIACNRIDELLFIRNKEGLAVGIEYAQLPAHVAINDDFRL